jgi:glycosyltransferase involved in cell wall biosynthesis
MNFQLLRTQLRKYFWYCRIYGLQSATRLAIRRLKRRNILPRISHLAAPDLQIPRAQEKLPLIDRKISAIIPTLNAGNQFPLLLRKLKAQKGIREIEIVVVDSGSSDDTLRFAKEHGAKVVEIAPESFNHGFARNTGAEHATGDFLLFTVQDVLPMTEHWLWEMANVLEKNDVVAVSCAEFPRSDCDLFYRLLMWCHYRHLHLDQDRVLAWDDSCNSDLGLRANSAISDLAAVFRQEVFRKYKYHNGFAEDLELGKRLIKDGHRIGFLYSTRVLHSHNRPAYYYLKRGYVDSRFRNEVFPGALIEISDGGALIRDIVAIYERTQSVAHTICCNGSCQSVGELIDRIRALYNQVPSGLIADANAPEDNRFDEFVGTLGANCKLDGARYDAKTNMILPHLLAHVAELENYLAGVYETTDSDLVNEVANVLKKMVALHAGNHMGYWYATELDSGKHDVWLLQIDKMLQSGV